MKKLILMTLLVAAAIAGCKQRGSAPEATEADDFPDTLAAATVAKTLPEEPVFDIVTNMGTIKNTIRTDIFRGVLRSF